MLGRAGHSSGASGHGKELVGLGSLASDWGSVLGRVSSTAGGGLGSPRLLMPEIARSSPPPGLAGSSVVSWLSFGSSRSLWSGEGKQRAV